ncbi:threonine ammonia-lyase, biosynthetic [Geothrix sp. PMB-07]|uniref:threonine ammonia-lyase, biosynthetic n=1 Tax=Geothrix sp. PMB-07 TaxID=3068640 RepID=UPI002741F58D|nr:threonine ammonia-lyase, biosynthetic [Geothrix sp. PMB-07]WLT29977.1 threonine ammonia-lyase, biosynthetic [Geothrix sp. PMB-07]
MNSEATQPSKDLLERILTALVYDVAIESPLEAAPKLSRRVGAQVWFKREDLQPVFSFKLRGAYNRIAHLQAAERNRGVIAASAGNHAQGVALATQKLGCQAVIVMPITTPLIKVEAVRTLGAQVVLHGDSFEEAYAHSQALAATEGKVYIHPYDDLDVIAGQGTIGLELLRQMPRSLKAVFVPVGGGGLIAGIAAYLKRLQPGIRIIGVEPVDADAMSQSLAAGHRVRLERVGLFADGVAVSQVGEQTFELCRKHVDEIVLVNTDEICAAIKDVFEETRSVLEPAGALAVAGLKAWAAREGVTAASGNLVAILSGANANFDRLRFVAERAELGERREAILAVTIPERPGSFRAFCELIGQRSITEFNYRLADPDRAHIFVGLQMASRAEVEPLLARLREEGLEALDLSDNEMAKLHVRHLVGGRAPRVTNERIYRFEFPERPGALLRFLDCMSRGWNISLFHYRNHGADYGRVLAGIQVPPEDQEAFQAFLDALGYRFVDEGANPAYGLFLA